MPDFLLPALITGVFIIFDIITGIMQAIKNKELSSEKLRQGAWHKMGLIMFICLAYFIDYGTGYLQLGFDVPIVMPLCVYISLTETVSIVENIMKLDPELEGSKIASFFKTSEVEPKSDKSLKNDDAR